MMELTDTQENPQQQDASGNENNTMGLGMDERLLFNQMNSNLLTLNAMMGTIKSLK